MNCGWSEKDFLPAKLVKITSRCDRSGGGGLPPTPTTPTPSTPTPTTPTPSPTPRPPPDFVVVGNLEVLLRKERDPNAVEGRVYTLTVELSRIDGGNLFGINFQPSKFFPADEWLYGQHMDIEVGANANRLCVRCFFV